MTEAEYRDGSPYLIYAHGSIFIADVRNCTYAEAPETDDQIDANARLIAAAPDLLEALESLNLVIGLTPIAGNKGPLQEACDIAREAIAKAKGGAL
jgi:hypothetical protein